jgi:hypothetical protein
MTWAMEEVGFIKGPGVWRIISTQSQAPYVFGLRLCNLLLAYACILSRVHLKGKAQYGQCLSAASKLR